MFWIACACHRKPEFKQVASIFRQIEAIPYSNQKQVDKQLHMLTQQLINMGVILEDPVSGNQWIHFLLSFIDEDVVEVRY